MHLKVLKRNIPIFVNLAITIIFIIGVYFNLNEIEMRIFINSDTLYLPSLFRDIVYDRSKDISWFTPGATCFFPDLIIFFLAHFFTANFIKAMFFSGILMNICLILTFYFLIKGSIKNITNLNISIGLNLLLLFHCIFLFTSDYFFSFYLTITNYHLGAYFISLFCFYFLINYLKTNKLIYLVILILLDILAVSSDFLTIFYLVIPLLGMNILFFKKQLRIQALKILISNILGFFLGFGLYRLLALSKAFNILNISYTIFKFDKILESYRIMFHHHFLYIKTMDIHALTLILCILSFIITLILFIKKFSWFIKSDNIEKSELLELSYLLFIIIQTVIVYNAPALNGAYLAPSLFRYNVYVFFLLVLNYGYLFHKLSQIRNLTRLVFVTSYMVFIIFFIIGLKVLIETDLRGGARKLFGFYPNFVKNVDEICTQYKIKYGLAAYWEARSTTMLSKKDIRIYQTYYNLRPYPHVVNQNWYYGTQDGKVPPPVFQFVIPNNLTDSIVYQKLENHIRDTLIKDEVTMILTDPFIIDRETKNLIFTN